MVFFPINAVSKNKKRLKTDFHITLRYIFVQQEQLKSIYNQLSL